MKNFNKIFFVSLLFQSIVPLFVFASEIRLETQKPKVHIGEQFFVNVVAASNESVNAIEGRVLFDKNLVTPIDVIDGDSVINFWVEKPKIKDEEISFSGATPVGFSGNNSKIISILFAAKYEGVSNIRLADARMYLNDGNGTLSTSTILDTSIVIDSLIIEKTEQLEDGEPPEDFTPMFVKDININEGKNSLVFSTRDKGLGIDSYYIREGRLGFYRKAESPYIIRNSDLSRNIYIKAKDKNSNERVVIFPAQNKISIFKQPLVILIISSISLVLFILFIIWKKFKK